MTDAPIGDLALDTTPVDMTDSPDVDVSAESSPNAVQEQSVAGSDGTTQTDTPLDGRKGPANIRNSIKAASEAVPEQAGAFKELGNAYFREQAYKQHFATPQEAASAKQLIEGVGGIDGITQIQQRMSGYDAQEQGLEAGDPAVLDSFFQDYPEGAVTLFSSYADRVAKANPQAFSDMIAPHAIGMLEQAGVGNHLAGIMNETDPGRQAQMIKQLAEWYGAQKGNIAQMKQAPQKSAGDDYVKTERAKIEEERSQIFTERVQEKVNSAVTPEINKYVDQYTKSYKLSDTQKKHFQEVLQQRVIGEMNADKTYEQQVNLRKSNKTKTHDSVAGYISSEFNRRLKDAAFNVAKEVYGAPKAGTQQGTGVIKADQPKQAPGGGPLFVSQRPSDSEMDMTHPQAGIMLVAGQAYLKNGRHVTWRKAS